MKTPAKITISSLAIVGIATTGIYLATKRTPNPVMVKKPSIDQNLMDAQKSPKTFIAKNADSKDKAVQTAVTRARMTEAYESAKKKDFTSARAEFIEASYKHKGTDAMNPAYGTLNDQAAYQAIVCLDASGKKDEATNEYRKFMSERTFSPLVHACARRLERLSGNKLLPEDQERLDACIAAQEKKIRFETSVCGPKCLEKILPTLGQPAQSYKQLAKLCKTTDQGTTMEGLKGGCEELGLKPVGLELNAKDFAGMTKPFLWLQNDHYLAVMEIKNGKAFTFDPRYRSEEWVALPKLDDANFRAIVLAFEIPAADLTTEVTKPKPALTNKPTLDGVKKK